MAIENKLSDRIEYAINALNNSTLSNYEIAKKTHISQSTLGNYKNGKTKPTLANAEILIKYFEEIEFRENNIENGVNDRIQQIINVYFNGCIVEFCNKLNLSQSAIKTILENGIPPTYDIIANIISNQSININPQWLLAGEGDMISNKSTEENATYFKSPETQNELFIETKPGIKYFEIGGNQYKMRVPFVPYNAYARYACDAAENIESTIKDWGELDFIVDRIGHGNYMAFEIKGDSMDDDSKRSFSHGDKVLARELDRIHWQDKIRYNHYPYWIIVLGNTILCKQIIDHNVETGEITCHSLNPSPEYKDFTVNLKSEVYRLFNIIQKLPVPINY